MRHGGGREERKENPHDGQFAVYHQVVRDVQRRPKHLLPHGDRSRRRAFRNLQSEEVLRFRQARPVLHRRRHLRVGVSTQPADRVPRSQAGESDDHALGTNQAHRHGSGEGRHRQDLHDLRDARLLRARDLGPFRPQPRGRLVDGRHLDLRAHDGRASLRVRGRHGDLREDQEGHLSGHVSGLLSRPLQEHRQGIVPAQGGEALGRDVWRRPQDQGAPVVCRLHLGGFHGAHHGPAV
mmetsp:Transcript_99677/g.286322  ORF Transcript_99677/g.286322 Transcript_99677/m.286322 type:complete len:237 (-) Transcript_99677:409-1119(-)